MADAADGGDGAGVDLAGQGFVVEAPEVLDAAAAAHQQQRIDLATGVRQADLRGQPAGRVGALHRRRIDDDRHLRRAPRQRRQHVAQRGGMQRGDHADGARHRHRFALARRIEQAFRVQLLFQAQEGFVQIAQAGAAHGVDLQLVVAARFVQRHPDPDFDLVARARHEADRAGAAPEHDGAHGGAAVLEREVPMPGSRLREVGNLAANPQCRDAALQQLPHRLVQLGNCQDIPRKYVVCDCKFNCHKAFRCVPVHRAYVAGRHDTASGHFCRGWPES
ncbi:Uncharacterised protein [Achromobacter sp. 2789STDY5608621]|nr:Uncharacterised protein [Achromobacter sp. 2789STDY5608621]